MPKQKITDGELRRYHKEGQTVRQICMDHGNITRIAIYARYKKLGMTPNPPAGGPRALALDPKIANMIQEIIAQKGGAALLEDAVVDLYTDTMI